MGKWRKKYLTAPLLKRVEEALPSISETEEQALRAGDTWWDAELLSGRPDWKYWHGLPAYHFTEEEQAFLDGPVENLCRMVDDWQINFEGRVPEHIWDYLREQRFFGMIIPREYGGLEFSAAAHSEVVTRIATRSQAVAVTVMVPNSLGPGELLMHFGTDAQKHYYLPRLAEGVDIPCFGLTSPEAGSDAAAMTDSGVICRGEYQGKEQLGIRLNWHKRYITLGPVATLLGLAFKLYDPDKLLGAETERGITLALVPTDLPGVDIGERHWPALQAFENGPNWGRDVFVPLDAIIGGADQIGQGWKMLMTALAAGRSISLPALSAGAAALAARSTGSYARVREQFGIPIGNFEGVQAKLANLSGHAYLLHAARRVTALSLDEGHAPAVVSAILKSQATARMRDAVTDAMDIHGGKAICDGPLNYLGNAYRGVPVAITVEGANILTRSLIIFGQGAIRCHPFLLAEINAVQVEDEKERLDTFDDLIGKHIKFFIGNWLRAGFHGLTFGRFAATPPKAGKVKPYYRQLSRYAAALAFVTEVSLLYLGGDLKRRERISGRLGDILSELYLSSCVLKQFSIDGEPDADLPVVQFCLQKSLATIEERFRAVFANFPGKLLGGWMRLTIFPFGGYQRSPHDTLGKLCAELLLEPSATRDRITASVFLGNPGDGLDLVEHALKEVLATAELRKRLHCDNVSNLDEAQASGLISEEDTKRLRAADIAVARAIEVDHFTPRQFTREDPSDAGKQSRERSVARSKTKSGDIEKPARVVGVQ